MSQRPLTFINTFPPGASKTYRHTFEQSGVIKGVRARFYDGQEFSLSATARLKRREGRSKNLWRAEGTEELAGNADEYDLDTRIEFDRGDELVIEAENLDATYEYTLNIVVDVDDDGSTVSQLAQAIKEVF